MRTVSITELIERKEQIEALIRQFNKLWPQHCVSAVVWELPLLIEQVAPDHIKLKHLRTTKAIELTKKMLLLFKRGENQHPATVTRLPGIIRLDRDFYGKVAEINAHKDALITRMQSIHPRTRPKYTRLAWPDISSLQLYRHLHAPYSTKRKVLFSWIGHTTSSTRTTRDKMINTVKLSRALVPQGVSSNDWDIVIDKEIALLATLSPSAHLVLQKQVAPHPRMMVYHQQEKQPTRTYGANLPLFIPDNKKMIVRELADWDREQSRQRKKRKDTLPSTPLISRLNLYLRDSL